jgi:hypothetical protein
MPITNGVSCSPGCANWPTSLTRANSSHFIFTPRRTFRDLDTLCNCIRRNKGSGPSHQACLGKARGHMYKKTKRSSRTKRKGFHAAARTRPIHTRRRWAQRVSPCEQGVMKKKTHTQDSWVTACKTQGWRERNSNRARLSRVANRKANSAKGATQSDDGHRRSERVLRRGLDPSSG